MNVLLWLPRALYKICFFIFFISTLILLYPFFYLLLTKRSRFKYCFKLMRLWARLLQLFGGIILIREFVKPLPKDRPYIICSNHSSYMDIILMYCVFKDYFVFMGKGEIENWPFFNIFFTKGMNILVYRESNMKAHRALLHALDEIDRGNPIAIFPEATIPNDAPKMKGFKNGAFKLAIEKQVPIVPVTFTANWKILQGSVLLKGKAGPGITRAIVHEPIETTGMTLDDLLPLRKRIFEIMEAPLKERFDI